MLEGMEKCYLIVVASFSVAKWTSIHQYETLETQLSVSASIRVPGLMAICCKGEY